MLYLLNHIVVYMNCMVIWSDILIVNGGWLQFDKTTLTKMMMGKIVRSPFRWVDYQSGVPHCGINKHINETSEHEQRRIVKQ